MQNLMQYLVKHGTPKIGTPVMIFVNRYIECVITKLSPSGQVTIADIRNQKITRRYTPEGREIGGYSVLDFDIESARKERHRYESRLAAKVALQKIRETTEGDIRITQRSTRKEMEELLTNIEKAVATARAAVNEVPE